MQVYFVTNRNPNRRSKPDGFGPGFNPDSPDSLRFGVATVEGSSVMRVDIAEERIGTSGKQKLGSQEVFAAMKQVMATGRDTVCLVHGYNTTFEEALIHGADMTSAWSTDARPLVPIVFSWPSDGQMTPFLAYKRDRDDALASGPALARALLKLRDFLYEIERGEECGAGLHLVAHSMGNYVLRNGIQSILRSSGKVPKLFDQILQVAADEDHDAFELDHKLATLPELGESVNVYFNRGDTALVISDRSKANPTRLGSRGPRLPLNVPGNVTLIDVSEAAGLVADTFGHNYHLGNEQVVRDIQGVLARTPADRIPGRRYIPSQNCYVIG